MALYLILLKKFPPESCNEQKSENFGKGVAVYIKLPIDDRVKFWIKMFENRLKFQISFTITSLNKLRWTL